MPIDFSLLRLYFFACAFLCVWYTQAMRSNYFVPTRKTSQVTFIDTLRPTQTIRTLQKYMYDVWWCSHVGGVSVWGWWGWWGVFSCDVVSSNTQQTKKRFHPAYGRIDLRRHLPFPPSYARWFALTCQGQTAWNRISAFPLSFVYNSNETAPKTHKQFSLISLK